MRFKLTVTKQYMKRNLALRLEKMGFSIRKALVTKETTGDEFPYQVSGEVYREINTIEDVILLTKETLCDIAVRYDREELEIINDCREMRTGPGRKEARGYDHETSR